MRQLRRAWLLLRHPGELRLARGVVVGRRPRLELAHGARVVVESGATIGDGLRVRASGAEVRIGRGARLGDDCLIEARVGVVVDRDALIGDRVGLVDHTPTFVDPDEPVRRQPDLARPIRVGVGAVIGSHAALLAGADVGDGAVVEAGSVVGGAVAAGERALGVPRAV